MDQLDKAIIALLLRDSRSPLKSIAATVGRSSSAVHERIQRLHATGAIRRFTIELASPKDELNAILFLKLVRTPMPEVVYAIVDRADVARCYSLSGEIDLLIELRGSSVESINASRDSIALIDGVTSVTTSFVLNMDKSERSPAPSKTVRAGKRA